MQIKNIGFAITGSFCTHDKILNEIKNLVDKGYNIIPIITTSVKNTDTRFGKADAFIEKLQTITGNTVVDNIVSAEPIGPSNAVDIIVVAPCTGNTLSKLANAITDNAVTMVVKSHLRNNKPVVIGISTNDALGLNLFNFSKLLNTKNFFFIPFAQDNTQNKPKSLIAKWDLTEETILKAANNEQLQPLLNKG